MNSFVTFRYQNQAKVRSFVGKKHVSKIARLQLQGGVIALESIALAVWCQILELVVDVVDP